MLKLKRLFKLLWESWFMKIQNKISREKRRGILETTQVVHMMKTQTCVHTCMGASQWDPFLVQLRYTAFEGENIFGRIILHFSISLRKDENISWIFFETLSIVDGDILTDLWYSQFLYSSSDGNEILLASTFQLLKGWVRKQPRK